MFGSNTVSVNEWYCAGLRDHAVVPGASQACNCVRRDAISASEQGFVGQVRTAAEFARSQFVPGLDAVNAATGPNSYSSYNFC